VEFAVVVSQLCAAHSFVVSDRKKMLYKGQEAGLWLKSVASCPSVTLCRIPHFLRWGQSHSKDFSYGH